MTLIINLFAGPGAGKSTTAAGLFYNMKKDGYSVELVTEYAKTRVWEEHKSVFDDQLYLTAKQARAINRLIGKVDYVITDSPILLGAAYTDDDELKDFIITYFNRYSNLNVFLERTKKYVQKGRNETEDQAKNKDKEIENLLAYHAVGVYCTVRDDEHVFENLYRQIFRIPY